jgi:Gas vesicle protein G
VGLISGLLTLPLAPVRGTGWIAEKVLEQAEQDYYDQGAIRAQLREIEQHARRARSTTRQRPRPRTRCSNA